MTEVIVVGSGPAGMMLAGELALAGVEATVVERRTTSELVGSRAGGFHSRTIEILDQRGIADRFLAEGQIAQTARFGTSVLDISDFPTRHPYGLALWQNRIEPILADWIEQLGVRVERGLEVTGIVQDENGVDVVFRDGETRRTKYVVGADGGRSVIRKAAGIEFPGWDATRSNLIAEVEVTEKPPGGLVQDERGVHALHLMEDGHTYRVVTTERQIGPATEPTLSDLSSALTAVYGTDFGVHSPTSISRFTDATRQAAAYRERASPARRGCRAHPLSRRRPGHRVGHPGCRQPRVEARPGRQRCLAAVASRHVSRGAAPRRSASAQALDGADGPATRRPAHHCAERNHRRSHDDGPGAHADRRAHPRPRCRLRPRAGTSASRKTDAGPRPRDSAAARHGSTRCCTTPDRCFSTSPVRGASTSRPGPTECVPSTCGSPACGSCRYVGEVAAPTAVLVRPDGHVAWVDPGSDESLTDALTRWFGPGR